MELENGDVCLHFMLIYFQRIGQSSINEQLIGY